MDKKNLAQVTVMLTTFLLAVPFTPAMAVTPASLSISPSSFSSAPGSSFNATVMVSNAPNLEAYDFKVLFNPDILQVTSTTLTGTLFDPAVGSVLVAKSDVFNSIGEIRYAVTFLGGATVSTNGALLIVTFQVNNPLQGTSSELPSTISIDSSLIGYQFPGPGTYNIAHTVSGATYAPGNSMRIRFGGCQAFNFFWSLSNFGLSPTVYCNLVNNGNTNVQGGAVFSWHSWHGLTGSSDGSVASYAPGQNFISLGTTPLPSTAHVPDLVIVRGQAATFYSFPDGTSYVATGCPHANNHHNGEEGEDFWDLGWYDRGCSSTFIFIVVK